jgi:hypothetical protein
MEYDGSNTRNGVHNARISTKPPDAALCRSLVLSEKSPALD